MEAVNYSAQGGDHENNPFDEPIHQLRTVQQIKKSEIKERLFLMAQELLFIK